MTNRDKHSGKCHCGNIHFTFETHIAVPEIIHRCCTCSFCRKQGARYSSDPGGRLDVSISQKENINRYRFGHKTADFIICKICGVMPFITSDIDGNTYAVLNINCLDNVDQIEDGSSDVTYDEEGTEDRLSRRKKRWIGTVKLNT